MTFKIDSSFIGLFKTGDNICYNAHIVSTLYEVTNKDNGDFLFKPKIIFNVSLIDAAFYDFIRRIISHKLEFQYLSENIRKKIRQTDTKKLNTFKKHINKFRHYNLLGKRSNLYEQIDELNTLRNRIHIQNENGSFHKDDEITFTKERLIQSERCTEFTLKYLSKNYPRKHQKYVHDIHLPWKEHFNEKMRW